MPYPESPHQTPHAGDQQPPMPQLSMEELVANGIVEQPLFANADPMLYAYSPQNPLQLAWRHSTPGTQVAWDTLGTKTAGEPNAAEERKAIIYTAEGSEYYLSGNTLYDMKKTTDRGKIVGFPLDGAYELPDLTVGEPMTTGRLANGKISAVRDGSVVTQVIVPAETIGESDVRKDLLAAVLGKPKELSPFATFDKLLDSLPVFDIGPKPQITIPETLGAFRIHRQGNMIITTELGPFDRALDQLVPLVTSPSGKTITPQPYIKKQRNKYGVVTGYMRDTQAYYEPTDPLVYAALSTKAKLHRKDRRATERAKLDAREQERVSANNPVVDAQTARDNFRNNPDYPDAEKVLSEWSDLGEFAVDNNRSNFKGLSWRDNEGIQHRIVRAVGRPPNISYQVRTLDAEGDWTQRFEDPDDLIKYFENTPAARVTATFDAVPDLGGGPIDPTLPDNPTVPVDVPPTPPDNPPFSRWPREIPAEAVNDAWEDVNEFAARNGRQDLRGLTWDHGPGRHGEVVDMKDDARGRRYIIVEFDDEGNDTYRHTMSADTFATYFKDTPTARTSAYFL